LARFAALASEDDDFLTRRALAALTRVVWSDGSLEAEAVIALERPISRRLLGRWLAGQGVPLDSELIDECLRAIARRGSTPLPGDRLLACMNGRVTLQPAPPRLHATSS
jgi:tRNA(Ile)-lysidine synthase